MLRFCLRIRYSSRSSGPSKASRNTSMACGGMYRSRGISVSGSPSTIAKGISTCDDFGRSWRPCSVAERFIAFRTICMVASAATLARRAPSRRISCTRPGFARYGAARSRITVDSAADLLDHRLLAVEASDARARTALLHPGLGLIVRIELVQIPHGTFFGFARIGAPHTGGIGLHGLDLARDRFGIFSETDGVARRTSTSCGRRGPAPWAWA